MSISPIPKILNMATQRFKYAVKNIIKIQPVKSQYNDLETMSFFLPANSTIDFETMALFVRPSFTNSSTTTDVVLQQFWAAQLFRRCELVINGQTVWGSSCSDFASFYTARRRLAQASYTTNTSDKVFVYPPAITVGHGASPTTYNSTYFVLDDLFAYVMKNCRFLPCSALGNVEIRFQLDMTKVTGTGTTLTSLGLSEAYLSAATYQLPDNLLDTLIAERFARGTSLDINMESWTNFSGTAYAGPSASVPFSQAASSIDYVILTNRDSSATGGASYFQHTSTGTTATHALNINGISVSTYPLALQDCFYTTVYDSLEGGSNLLVDPQISSLTAYAQTAFYLMHKFALPSADQYDSDRMVSGLSTYGSIVPMSYEIRGATSGFNGVTNFQPLIFVITTTTLEVQPGKVCTLVV